jgi:hypothetical protein
MIDENPVMNPTPLDRPGFHQNPSRFGTMKF